ncbi:unnamed protein product [Paramecium octaurelia]|uniref:Uncharacterized protein n=1 Tax=Paramecium octaurelia TaxID=43137 RepID=A0A8S1W960_PAROT|nr:unnamed protein product [Paramecium octaurelia]
MIQSKPMNNMGYQPKNCIRLGQLKKIECCRIIQKRGRRVKKLKNFNGQQTINSIQKKLKILINLFAQ